jgi:hypothetical protein
MGRRFPWPRGGLSFSAFDFLRLNDAFVGQFSQLCLHLSIAEKFSVRPAFVT